MKRLWFNGNVVTMDKQMTRCQAIGIQNGKIIFLGDTSAAMKQSWDETNDLHGAMVLPGFNDTHMHLLYYAMFQKNVSLFGASSIEDIIQRCKVRIDSQHPGYLLGMGWNQELLAENRMPNREDMDRISSEIPVCLLRACAHIASCNSVMLDRIRSLHGIDPETLSHVDFINGLLREDALRLYIEVLPKQDDAYVRELMQIGQRDLNAAGITCVHSDDLKVIAGMDPIHLIDLLRQMEAEGQLTVRLYEQCLVDQTDFNRLLAVRNDPADRTSLFRTGPRKLLQDGSLGAKSAEMIHGYADDPSNHGIPIYTEDELFHWINSAHLHHMDVAVHAIGDLALQKVCRAVEQAQQNHPWAGHRHGIVHAQTTTPALLEEMKALGLQAYIQPIFIDADMEIIEQRVGHAHARDCYNWKSMEDLGIHISGGSDCPVEPFSILDNMRAAITRQNRNGSKTHLPEQALSVEQAIRLFTSDAAWASRYEAVRGTLEPGKMGDLVILDQDLFKTDPQDFPQVKILETVLNGQTVYRHPA